MAFQQNRRGNFSHFVDMVNTGLFFTFSFVKVNGNYKNRELDMYIHMD